jgi:hypothetical protein
MEVEDAILSYSLGGEARRDFARDYSVPCTLCLEDLTL